jgi:hypothetical protein
MRWERKCEMGEGLGVGRISAAWGEYQERGAKATAYNTVLLTTARAFRTSALTELSCSLTTNSVLSGPFPCLFRPDCTLHSLCAFRVLHQTSVPEKALTPPPHHWYQDFVAQVGRFRKEESSAAGHGIQMALSRHRNENNYLPTCCSESGPVAGRTALSHDKRASTSRVKALNIRARVLDPLVDAPPVLVPACKTERSKSALLTTSAVVTTYY